MESPIRSRRVRGLASLALGLGVCVVAGRATPLASPPLYDGVVVVEPYRWLVPPAGQKGDPKSASGTARLENGASPLIALATEEVPPQAQIFATPGTLVLPAGTTSIKMSIKPILPQALPSDGHISGNVYRITITNQTGVPLTAPPGANVTVVLRGPDSGVDETIEQSSSDGWNALSSQDAGFGSAYLATVTSFGDFALVAPGAGGPYPTATPRPTPTPGPEASEAASSSAPASTGTPHSSATATATATAGDSEPVAVAPIESISLGPSAPPTGGPSSGPGGWPFALIAAVVALLALAILGPGAIRQRRRRGPRHRGARPRRR